jgi:hypothetical protein
MTQISRLVTRPGFAYDIGFQVELQLMSIGQEKLVEAVKLVLCNRTVRGEECDRSRTNAFIDIEGEANAALGEFTFW